MKHLSTRFSIVRRSMGHSAVDKASYISRSVLHSEYDGIDYRPKYHEYLVHSEISLPKNVPENSVNAQGQRNLHFHVLLTMRPLTPDGKWGELERQEKGETVEERPCRHDQCGK